MSKRLTKTVTQVMNPATKKVKRSHKRKKLQSSQSKKPRLGINRGFLMTQNLLI